ncbi:MAG: pseudouridine synthase [Planctomycetota bacterium]|nr:pseudouridine synthase [Planctomycetota bacterium]
MVNKKQPRRRTDALSKRPRSDAQSKAPPVLAEDAAETPFEFVGEPRLVRLNKYLADHGVASRRKCDELIESGQVTVDGAPVNELGMKIDPDRQQVEIDGVYLKPKDARRRYYLLNKPSGVVCTNEPRETRPRAVDLVTDPAKGRIYTVGRLDEESKGLIILTNDGDFANKIMHPRYGIDKTYVVRVAGRIDDDTVQKIRDGVHLSEGRTSGARILVDRRTVDTSQLTLTIHEGMNREIRRVFARFGYKVVDLRRVRIGPLDDRGLKPGRWRELLNREVEALLKGKASMEGDIAPRANKHFPKKKGYARGIVRGGKLVPGIQRVPEPRIRFGAPGAKKASKAGAKKETRGSRQPTGRTQRNRR